MIVIGHVPLGAPSLLVTVNPPSPHASVIVNPAPRRYASVSVAAGRSAAVQPSTDIGVSVPVTVGAVVSSIVIVCCAVLLLPQASVTV